MDKAIAKSHLVKQLALWSFILALLFSHIHQGDLSIDGIRYAHISSELLETGDWLNLWDEFKGERYSNKPPLLFWIFGLSIDRLGYSSFSMRLPGALLGFLALVIFWYSVKRYYGERIADFSMLLLVLNKVFLRSVPDASFEGILLLGVVLLFRVFLQLIFNDRPSGLLVLLGSIVILFTKPLYLVIVLIPFVIVLLNRRILPPTYLFFFLGSALSLSLAWYFFQGSAYTESALDNQLTQTMMPVPGEKLPKWLGKFFIGFFPLSVICLFYRRGLNHHDELLAWFLPAVLIMLFLETYTRYLIGPALSLAVFAGAYVVEKVSLPIKSLATIAVLLIILLQLNLAQVHRSYDFLKYLQLNSNISPVICLDGKGNGDSPDRRKRAELLLDLQLKKNYQIAWSGELQAESTLANAHCKTNLAKDFACSQAGSSQMFWCHQAQID